MLGELLIWTVLIIVICFGMYLHNDFKDKVQDQIQKILKTMISQSELLHLLNETDSEIRGQLNMLEQSMKRECPDCRQMISVNSKYCPKCGGMQHAA